MCLTFESDSELDLMRYRQLLISTVTISLPLVIPSNHSISLALGKTLGSVLPPTSPRPSASSPFKVFVRTGAAISAGHALEYIYSRQQGCEPTKSYDEVSTIVNRCISMLVVKPDSPAMFYCDAVPMVFW